MTKTIKYTNSFKKDLKGVQQYKSFSREVFQKYVDMLAAGEQLPPNTKDHALAKHSPKQYKGLRDFHTSPDICVIYDLQPDSIILHRIGKHNKLGLVDSYNRGLKLRVNF